MAARSLLILSVSAGAGHVCAAEALRARAEADYPGVKAIHRPAFRKTLLLPPKPSATKFTDAKYSSGT